MCGSVLEEGRCSGLRNCKEVLSNNKRVFVYYSRNVVQLNVSLEPSVLNRGFVSEKMNGAFQVQPPKDKS